MHLENLCGSRQLESYIQYGDLRDTYHHTTAQPLNLAKADA